MRDILKKHEPAGDDPAALAHRAAMRRSTQSGPEKPIRDMILAWFDYGGRCGPSERWRNLGRRILRLAETQGAGRLDTSAIRAAMEEAMGWRRS